MYDVQISQAFQSYMRGKNIQFFNFNPFMEYRLTVLEKLHDKNVTLINKSLDIYE